MAIEYMPQKSNKRLFTKVSIKKEQSEVTRDPHHFVMTSIFLLPRILSVLFVCLLSLFALDIFSSYQGVALLIPLLMHLLPTFILLGVIIVAWKFELVGAITFLGFAIFYVFSVGLERHWSWYTAISLPSAIIGIFYLISWYEKRKNHLHHTIEIPNHSK